MPQSAAQQRSVMSMDNLQRLVHDVKKRQLADSYSTQRKLSDEEMGQEALDPDIKKSRTTTGTY